ncbi:hypothetical protein MASR2M117_06770 [Paludibacter sp.]
MTPNPQVDSYSSDETFQIRITSVLTEDEFTLVTFQYATTQFKPWIALDDKTVLTSNHSKERLKVLEWGIIIEDDEDISFNALHFDQQYNVKRRVAYNFYMVFPAIPEKTTLLNIVEPDGFYWKGIHINNKTTEDLSKDHQYYSNKGEFQPSGSGSGFAISSDGYIATCYHVIAKAKAIRIRGANGNYDNALKAKVVAVDEQNDLAILKIDDAHFSQLPYSFAIQPSDVGENIFVLGYPQTQHLGEELKLTTGVISSRSGYRGDVSTYQISAQVLPGNSGCPLFDDDGRIIGVVNAKYIEPNVSYAVKLNYLKSLIEKSNINLKQPVNNAITGKSLAEKVKSIRNFIYIIEIEE